MTIGKAMNDNELLNLHKQVYEKTGWFVPNTQGFMNEHGLIGQPWVIPIYTSDYLLEKLPHNNKGDLQVTRQGWSYSDEDYREEDHWLIRYGISYRAEYGKTPLIALLKLTLALAEAGQL
jgi:hypothetical protein